MNEQKKVRAKKMTKKDYVLIANVIAKTRGEFNTRSPAEDAINWVAINLADTFAAGNPRFDRGRFLTAAHPPKGGE